MNKARCGEEKEKGGLREGLEKERRIRGRREKKRVWRKRGGFGERGKEWQDRVRGKKREGEEKEEGGE